MVHVYLLDRLNWRSILELMELIETLPTGYDCKFHDYAAVCHCNNLLLPHQFYCGMPDTVVCRKCIALDEQVEEYVDPDEPRQRFAAFLSGARRVFGPSDDVVERLGGRLPFANAVVRPHEEAPPAFPLPARTKNNGKVLSIALVGAIEPHKGADVIYNLALDAQLPDLPIRFTIVGYFSNTETMSKVDVRETGLYQSEEEALAQLRKLGPDVIFLPSIWPETYCYTLSLALAAGIPPVVFDIGAHAERLVVTGEGAWLDLN